jgi:hypothetical protein
MRPDYAKEIAKRALITGGSDRDLLTIVATYCIHELGYHMNTSELFEFVASFQSDIEKWDAA